MMRVKRAVAASMSGFADIDTHDAAHGRSALSGRNFAFAPIKNQSRYIQMGRGILLWMLGVPLPIILLLAMCSHN